MPIIECTDVAKSFKGVPLLSGVDLTVEEGRIYGLTGPNGSGKSVLLKMLCGFISPDSGTVAIDPAYMSAGAVFPQEFGVIIDRPAYIAGLSGLDNLLGLARIRNVIGEEEVRAAMASIGLDPASRTKVGRYSLGMKQKLSIVQATMEHQRMLVLDEPFNALDKSSVAHVRAMLDEHRANGGTIILTSHNDADIELLADEVHEIDGGTLTRVR